MSWPPHQQCAFHRSTHEASCPQDHLSPKCHPIRRLLVLNVIHGLGLQDLPILIHAAFVELLMADLNADSVVWLCNQSVQAGCAITVLFV